MEEYKKVQCKICGEILLNESISEHRVATGHEEFESISER